MSLAFLKLRVSEKFRKAKQRWHEDPTHHGTEEIPPRAKKSCTNQAKNGIARVMAQVVVRASDVSQMDLAGDRPSDQSRESIIFFSLLFCVPHSR
jgi:hypothetical protein